MSKPIIWLPISAFERMIYQSPLIKTLESKPKMCSPKPACTRVKWDNYDQGVIMIASILEDPVNGKVLFQA